MSYKGFGSPNFKATPRGYLPVREGFEVIRGNLLMLLNTSKGERVNLPEYGTDLRKLLFGQLTEDLLTRIREEVIQAIDTWEPSIVVNDLTVGLPDDDHIPAEKHNDHVISIRLDYSPKDDLSLQDRLEVLLPNI